MNFNTPIFPIPPSFNNSEEFDEIQINNYLEFLNTNGAEVIMTTAGTSQFNLLSIKEIRKFNEICLNYKSILGLPALNLKSLLYEISLLNKKYNDFAILLLYPERYYNDDTIVKYFHKAADISKHPIFIHGLSFRSGINGIYNFTAELINKIAEHNNIIGMKEESSNFNEGFELCKNIKEDFIKIVAGGSQRRFSLLNISGAQTFLAGIGNIYPKIEIDFYNMIKDGNIKLAYELMNKYETKLFDVFMKIGWHKSLREGLKQKNLCCLYNRQPFPGITIKESEQIKNVLKIMDEYE